MTVGSREPVIVRQPHPAAIPQSESVVNSSSLTELIVQLDLDSVKAGPPTIVELENQSQPLAHLIKPL